VRAQSGYLDEVFAPDIVEPWLAEVLPQGRSGFPADIANAALWLASSEPSFVTGQALVVDVGLTSVVLGRKSFIDGTNSSSASDQPSARIRSLPNAFFGGGRSEPWVLV
jgi:hypothetical protein